MNKKKLILLIIFGIISVLLIIYFVPKCNDKKESISLELDFYKDDISPVYCLPWNAIPELHDSINKLLNIYAHNLPKGDIYHLHDKIPEFKMRFNDASHDLLKSDENRKCNIIQKLKKICEK